MNEIAKTQQTLNQIAENNKHIKRNYDDTIEIEEDYLRELLETINNLCKVNKTLQDQFELSQKLVSVLQDKLRRCLKARGRMKDYLLKHYARTYENFDKCMACFEDLIVICQKQQNYEIAERIKTLLSELELVKESEG